MRTYNLNEVSKMIHVPARTLKQWEKDLSGLLEISRSKQGSRLYTSIEINLLKEIRQFYQDNLDIQEIRDILQEKLYPPTESIVNAPRNLVAVVSEAEADSLPQKEQTVPSTEDFFTAMDQYKQTFLSEVKNEIKKVVQTEVVEEVKKEISKGTMHTVKAFSDSIYKSGANTIEEIKELAYTIQTTAQETKETYKSLERNIVEQSLETSEEFYTIAKQVSETSEELSHYIDITNKEISILNESLEKDREYYIEEREQFRHEIRQRELAFQSWLSSVRDAASSKTKKWWKFW